MVWKGGHYKWWMIERTQGDLQQNSHRLPRQVVVWKNWLLQMMNDWKNTRGLTTKLPETAKTTCGWKDGHTTVNGQFYRIKLNILLI